MKSTISCAQPAEPVYGIPVTFKDPMAVAGGIKTPKLILELVPPPAASVFAVIRY